MTIPDHIFDECLALLEQGQTAKQAASRFPEYSQELESLLGIAEIGLTIPKLTPPIPYRQHKFASARKSTGFLEILSFARFAAIPLSLVVILLGGLAVADATQDSIPGEKLYSLKRASEEVRLTLAQDQDKVANLHVEMMQKRLDEVKKAADRGNATSETLALAELQSQTEKTFAEVGPVATANAISKQDSTLLDNLVAVNKQQKDVLTELTETSDNTTSKTVATTALEDSKKNDQALAKIIATVNDQTMADLPNKVSVTGGVTLLSTTRLVVEKNTFILNDETVITNPDGTTTTEVKAITGRATVVGLKMTDGSLVAKQVMILPVEDGTVKGDNTVKPTPKPVKPAPLPNSDPTKPTNDSTEPFEQEEPPTAQGNFITEPSTSQYNP